MWYNDGDSAQWVQTNGGEGTADLPITGGTLLGPLVIEDNSLRIDNGHVASTRGTAR